MKDNLVFTLIQNTETEKFSRGLSRNLVQFVKIWQQSDS